eukprot:GFUD01034756.1.p1 GENE.GFUD01034756.1~~GFUD01034756.1.p1  ORF type:complete len:116 (-),score=28.29 GFUD01034756.1:79-426(-)
MEARERGDGSSHLRGEKEKVGGLSFTPAPPAPAPAPSAPAASPVPPVRLMLTLGDCVEDPTRPLASSTLVLSIIALFRTVVWCSQLWCLVQASPQFCCLLLSSILVSGAFPSFVV